MDEATKQWAIARGLTADVLSQMRVEDGAAQFGDSREAAIVFGYYRDGERVNYKARSLAGKKYKQLSGGEQRFYNLDSVLDGSMDTVWITEGEVDAISLVQCGITAVGGVLSVPTGAPAEASEDAASMNKYTYVLDALDQGLCNVTRYVIATDNDDPGRALRKDLVALLGAAKCWFVDWPDAIKDANEGLVAWGPEQMRLYLSDAQQEWPIAGLYTLDQVPEPPKLELWDCGFPEWDGRVKIAARTLSVMTGFPGHGKTHFSQQVWYNICRSTGIKVALLSAETGIKPHVRKNMRQFFHGKEEYTLTDDQNAEADEWIGEHFVFVNHPNARPTFPWLCEMIEAAHARHGCRAFVLDPWNKLETNFDRRQSTETQWIGECLDDLLDLTRSLDMHIMILAHPAKITDQKAKNLPVDLGSISGSAHWSNRVDQGFSIHREQTTNDDGTRNFRCDFYHVKARFEELGWPCRLPMMLGMDKSFFSTEGVEI